MKELRGWPRGFFYGAESGGGLAFPGSACVLTLTPGRGRAYFLVIIPVFTHIYIMLKHVQFSKKEG